MSGHRRNQAFVRSVAPGEVGVIRESNLFSSQNIVTITTIRQAFCRNNFYSTIQNAQSHWNIWQNEHGNHCLLFWSGQK
jgi:hypothetical protein